MAANTSYGCRTYSISDHNFGMLKSPQHFSRRSPESQGPTTLVLYIGFSVFVFSIFVTFATVHTCRLILLV